MAKREGDEQRPAPWGRQALGATILCVVLVGLALTASGGARALLAGLALLLALIAIYAQGQRRRVRDEARRARDEP